MIGTTVNHYRILEKLGEGGMGVVYKATDTTLDRLVALKFLPENVAAGSSDLERFSQEAKAAAGLNHPNICTIYGIEQADGPSTSLGASKRFIVMEYVDGQTLQEKKSSLSMKQALDVGIQIAEGLAAAHDKGVVHRDIKPDNIMFRKDGRVQIMDFGLAKLRGASRLTKEGSTVGTAGYMSPEQVQGQETDHRSDIFSLGVLLFEMLTGQAPFKGVHETAIAYEIVNVDTPPPSTVRPEIAPELDTIVLECLEKDPQERTQSAGQVAVDLKRYRRSSSRSRSSMVASAQVATADGTTPLPRIAELSRSFRWPGLLFVGAVMLMAGYLLAVLQRSEPTRELRKFTLPMHADQAFLSPDGSRIAGFRGKTITIRRFDSMDTVTVQSPDDILSLLWSPNGDHLAYFTAQGTYQELRTVSAQGMGQTSIARLSNNSWPRYWGTDDSIVFNTWDNASRNMLMKVASTGGSLVPMYGGDSSMSTIAGNLSSVLDLPEEHAQILSINTSNGQRILVQTGGVRRDLYTAPPGGFIDKVNYAPDGYLLFTQANGSGGVGYDLWALPFDVSTLTASGKAFIVARNATNASVSSNGMMAYAQRTATMPGEELVILDRTGRVVNNIQRSTSELTSPSVSRDGASVALNEIDRTTLRSDIWLYDLRKKTKSQFSIDVPLAWGAAWSPDGREIAYTSGYFDTVDVYVQSTNGLSPAKALFNSPAIEFAPRYAPDGRTIFYVRREPGGDNNDIWFAERSTPGTARPLFSSRFKETFPCPSPDGRYVAYQSDRSGQDEVYVTRFPEADHQWQVSFAGGAFPQWVGDEIFFVESRSNRLMSAKVSARPDFRSELPRPLFSETEAGVHVQAWWTSKYAVLGDGKHLVAARAVGKASESVLVIIEQWSKEFQKLRTP